MTQSNHSATATQGGIPVWVWGGATVLIIVGILTLWGGSGSEPMPIGMVGNWATSAPKYAGRSLELTPTTVVFDGGSEGAVAFPIDTITAGDQETNGKRYVLTYRGEDNGRYRLILLYDEMAEPNQLRLANQPTIVWEQVPEFP